MKNSTSQIYNAYQKQKDIKLQNLFKNKSLKPQSNEFQNQGQNKKRRILQQTPYLNPWITQEPLQFAFCKGNNKSGVEYCYTNEDSYNTEYIFNCSQPQNNSQIQICMLQVGPALFINNTFYSQNGIMIQWFSYQENGNVYQCASNQNLDLQCVLLFVFNKTLYFNSPSYQCISSQNSTNVSCYSTGNNPAKLWDWNCDYDNHTQAVVCQSFNGSTGQGSAYILLETGIGYNSSGNNSDINIFFTQFDNANNKFFIQSLTRYNAKNSKWRVKTSQQKYCFLDQFSQNVTCYDIDGYNYNYNCKTDKTKVLCEGIGKNSQGRQQTTYLNTGFMYNTDKYNTTIDVFYCNTYLSSFWQQCTYLYSIQQYGEWTQNIIYDDVSFAKNQLKEIPPKYEFSFCLEKYNGTQECYTNDDNFEVPYVNYCSQSQWNSQIVHCLNYVENKTTTNSTLYLKQNVMLQWNYQDNEAEVFQCQFDQKYNSVCKLMFTYDKSLSFIPQAQTFCQGDNKTNYACYSYGSSTPSLYQCSYDNISNSLVCSGTVNTQSQGFTNYIQIGTGFSTYSFQNTTDVTKMFCDVNLRNNSVTCTQLYSYNERSLQLNKTPLQKICVGNSSGVLKCNETDGKIYNYNCKYNNISNALLCLDVNQTQSGGRNYTTYLNSGIQYGIDSSSNKTIQVHYCNTILKNLTQNCTYLYNIDYFGGMSSQLASYLYCDQNILGDLLCWGISGSTAQGLTCMNKKGSNITVCERDNQYTYCMYQNQYKQGIVQACTNDFKGKYFLYQSSQAYSDIMGFTGTSYLYSGSPCQNVSVEQCSSSIHYNPNYNNRTAMNLTFYFTENTFRVRNSTNAMMKIGQFGSYCLSQNGKSCYSDYGMYCDLSTGYNCTTDYFLNLKNVTYCYTKDSNSCYNDSGSFCKDSNCYLATSLNTRSQYCATSDGKYCYVNQTIIMTKDYENLTSPIKIFEETGYCVAFSDQTCYKSYGSNCNLTTSYMCTRSPGDIIVQSLSNCITADNLTCLKDWGQLCNYTGNYNYCNTKLNVSKCLKNPDDNYSCQYEQTGWYYTLDGNNTISQGQAQIYNGIYPTYAYYSSQNNQSKVIYPNNVSSQIYGSYCYSLDGLSCLQDYGDYCDETNHVNCSTIDGINPIKVGYFYTNDGKSVYKDIGAELCNFEGAIDEVWCNIQVSTADYCESIDGTTCYQQEARFYMTFDNYNVNEDPFAIEAQIYGKLAQYCYSKDGEYCIYNNGEKCDPETSINCSEDYGGYCVSLDNQTCYQDYGEYCNNTDKAWCMIDEFNNYCFTTDETNCFNFLQGFCYTLDQKYCIQQDFSTKIGSYCWSEDGSICTGQNIPTCFNGNESSWYLNGANCGNDLNDSFCITKDGINCLWDEGYFCNNVYDVRWCNIDASKVQTCLTTDSLTCSLSTQTNQEANALNVAKRRTNFRDYFYYAIDQPLDDVNQISNCSNCLYYQDSCCVQVNQTITDSTASFTNVNFDNFCMNKHIIHSSQTFQLDNTNYTLQCRVKNIKKLNAVTLRLTFAFLLASIFLFIA